MPADDQNHMLNSTAGTCTARHLRARTLPRLLIIPLYRFWVGSVSCRSKNSSRQYKLADAACRTGQRVILSPHCIRHDPWNKTLKATSIRTCSGTPPICWIVSGGSHDVIEVPPKSLSRMPIGTCRISMSCRLQVHTRHSNVCWPPEVLPSTQSYRLSAILSCVPALSSAQTQTQIAAEEQARTLSFERSCLASR